MSAETVSPVAMRAPPLPIAPGARALAMGGAFAAIADDVTAVTWNPAGLAQMEEVEFHLSAGHYLSRTDQRTEGELEFDYAAAVLPLPYAGFPQSLAVAWQRSFDFGHETSSHLVQEIPGRLPPPDFELAATIDKQESDSQHGSLAQLGVAYAIEPILGLRFGASLSSWDHELTGASDLSWRGMITTRTTLTAPTGAPVLSDTIQRTTTESHTEVTQGLSWQAGILWQALPQLRLAAVYTPRHRLDLRTRFDIQTETEPLAGTAPPPDQETQATIDSELTMPQRATAGIAWRPQDRTTFSLEGSWVRLREAHIDSERGTRSPYGNDPDDPHDDAWSVALGVEHVLLLEGAVMTARAGANWEQRPGLDPLPLDPNSTVAPDPRLDCYYGLAVGSSLFLRYTAWDLALSYRWADDVGTGWLTSVYDRTDHREAIIRLGTSIIIP